MHPLTFEAKRTHWNATWEAIRLYRACGENWKEPTLEDMTPARCDILQTVWNNNAELHEVQRGQGLPPGKRSMHLADVRKTLGLAGATVWKCVQRLAELEWVTLEPSKQTKRWIVVKLTELGVHALRMAQRCAREETIAVSKTRVRRGFNRLVDDFVRRDAEAQGVVADVPTTARKSFRHWRDYYWWLIGHMRTMAKHFGCKAARLYHREPDGETVRQEDDRSSPETPASKPPPNPASAIVYDEAWYKALLAAPELADEKFPS